MPNTDKTLSKRQDKYFHVLVQKCPAKGKCLLPYSEQHQEQTTFSSLNLNMPSIDKVNK